MTPDSGPGASTGELIATAGPFRPLSVLSVVHSAAFGGPHNQAVQLHRELGASSGLRLTVVLPEEPGEAPPRLRAAGIHVVQMALARPRASRSQQGWLRLVVEYPRQIQRLRRLIDEQAIDVVEVHGLLNLDGAIAGRLAGRGVIWQLIDTRPPKTLRWLVMPIVLLLADVIMTTGMAVAAEYPGARLRPDRLRAFIPPVRPARLEGDRARATRLRTRAELGVPDDALLIASVGNLNPQKGYAGLLAAAAACRAGAPDLELRIRGGTQEGHGSYVAGLQARAGALGLSVRTVGGFEEGITVSDLMISSDIFVLASTARSEGLPTVVLEAMARSLPIISTDVGSIAEVVLHGESGLLVPPDDVDQLTLALKRLVADPLERRRLGVAARAVAEEKASPPTFARLQLEAYELASDRHPRGRRSSRRDRAG